MITHNFSQEADRLAYEVGVLVHKMAGGVGPEPVQPEKKIIAHI